VAFVVHLAAVLTGAKRSFPADRAGWLKARDAIYEEVMAKGWSKVRGSFVQSYGSDALDASVLLMHWAARPGRCARSLSRAIRVNWVSEVARR
jgi:hypothetical protein